MTTLPELVPRWAVPEPIYGSDDGKGEVDEFDRVMGAYDPRFPETGERMIGAFLRFRELGYEAYFRGVPEAPKSILVRPLLVGMWKFGFDAAEFDAAIRRCKCDCDKRYVWGQGYGKCPRIPQDTQRR